LAIWLGFTLTRIPAFDDAPAPRNADGCAGVAGVPRKRFADGDDWDGYGVNLYREDSALGRRTEKLQTALRICKTENRTRISGF